MEKYIISFLALFPLLHCIHSMNIDNNKSNGKTLKMVHLLYRHGARSPVEFYPTYPNKDKWPDGIGRLTQKGMNLEYDLGKFLKERYMINTSFIDQMYLHGQVYIRSSDEERCLQSAESQLAGLYPPSGRQIWNKEIPWQPVPVHTVPPDHDPLLRPDKTDCPRLAELREAKKSEPLYKQKLEENQDLLKYLTSHSGMTVNFENLYIISDTYICEKEEGFTSPQWVLNRLNETLDIASWLFLNDFKGNDEMGRLLGGSLLYVINNNMKAMSQGQTPLFKMNIFSGHDTSILALATALNIEISVPTFASCLMVELYEDDKGNFFVEMQYRNDSSGRLYPFELTECEFSCPLDAFVAITKNRVTSDQEVDCHKSQEKRSNHQKWSKKITLSFIIGGLVLMLLMLYVIFCCCRRRRNKKNAYVDETETFINQDL